jgi:integrase
MPKALVDLSGIILDETEERYLQSKTGNTEKSYRMNLKRFRLAYPGGIKALIQHIEKDRKQNESLPIHQRVRPGEDILRNIIEWHKEIGYSNKSIRLAVTTIQNTLKYYGITVSLAFIDLPPNQPMKDNKKHEWSLEQMRTFVESAEYLRDKAYIMFGFQSGLAISDILALNYRDIQHEFEQNVLPLSIQGYRKKTGTIIRTFIGRDAIHYLRLYLQSRPDIDPREPIFTMLGSNERATPASIQKQLRKYSKKLKFIYKEDLKKGYSPARSHSLRSAFRSRLTGKMDGNLIEYFMAHAIGQHITTYMNQPLEELRELYANYEYLLAIEKTSQDEFSDQSGKTRIPEEALIRINSLETTVQTLTNQMAEMQRDFKTVFDYLKKSSLDISE